jgi:molybdenum cofactor biosynthesis enzyme MoaA
MTLPAGTFRASDPQEASPLLLSYVGWTCRRLNLVGDNEIVARFEALGSADAVDVQIVPKDATSTAVRHLRHCSVRYRAHIGSLARTERAQVGAMVMGLAEAIDERLAQAPGATMAAAFGRRSGGVPFVLSPESVFEVLAPEISLLEPLFAGWRLEQVTPESSGSPRDRGLRVGLHFESATSQRLTVLIGRRDDSRPSVAQTAHLSVTHKPFDRKTAEGADAVLALVIFLLQVRDAPGIDVTVPDAPPNLHPANDERVAVPDDWDLELSRLHAELKKKNLACLRPWTTAERMGSWQVLPCCNEYLRPEVLLQCDSSTESLMDAWNSPGLQAVRRAIASGNPHATCREDCPTFHADNEQSDAWIFAKPASRAVYDNTVKVLHEMIDGVERVESIPPHIHVAVEEDCNIRCVMCGVVADDKVRERPQQVLSAAGAEEIAALLPAVRSLCLNGGEPTMAPVTREILSRLDVEKHPDTAAQMITNGILLTPKYMEALKKARLQLIVSVNAATPATFERITGRKGGFERVMQNIRALVDPSAGFLVPPHVMLSFVVMKDNYRELPAFFRIAHELKVSVRLLPVFGVRGNQSFFTDEASLREVSEFFEREVVPSATPYAPEFRTAAERMSHLLKERLERRDFSAFGRA